MEGHRECISDIIDKSPLSGLQIIVLCMCFAVVAMDGFDIAAISYIAPDLQREWVIQHAQLAPVFAAGLLGMLVGSIGCGPLSDRYGRKRLLMMCLLIVGLCTLGSSLASSLSSLAGLRFLTGVGLGGVLPNCITLSSEYAPARRRMLLVTLSYSGFTLGMSLGGLVAEWILPHLGWRGMLFTGGCLPLLFLPLLHKFLPESVCYLANHPAHESALRAIMTRISGRERWDGITLLGDVANHEPRSPVSALFEDGRSPRTLLLWLTFFCCLFVFYLLTNWLPTVLGDSGYPHGEAARIAAMIPLGGVLGGIVMALLMDRMGAEKILPLLCIAATAALILAGTQLEHSDRLMAVMFLVGFTLTGALNNLSILAATLYPTLARATGVSWSLGAGRAGSIVGSMLGAWLFDVTGQLRWFFMWIALPVLVASFALVLLKWRWVKSDDLTLAGA